MGNTEHDGRFGLRPYLTPMGAWALAFGCSVGWGAFVMPGTTFLPLAGPLGTVLGILIGGFLMLLIGCNYHFMMNIYKDCGGTFTFVKYELGYDHGFLSAWFLCLVYMAIIWANATAIPLISRYLWGGIFEHGPHYSVAGYDVYLLEALVSVAALAFAGFVCACGGRVTSTIQISCALILFGGIFLCASAIFFADAFNPFGVSPAFATDDISHAHQVMRVVALAPWAFIGFESISHSTEEFRFHRTRVIGIMFFALLAGVCAYGILSFIAVSAVPAGYENWTTYIANLDDIRGIEALPVFNAVYTYIGKTGIVLLGVTTIAGFFTGLIGNMVAASRLIYAVTRDDMVPKWFGKLGRRNVPTNAIIFVVLLSLPIPFLGRTAIGWIIDVNTIGATIAFAYTSLGAYLAARRDKRDFYKATGISGFIISIFLTLYFLIPNICAEGNLASESYFILLAWGILGFAFFYYILKHDEMRRFGRSTVALLVLLFHVIFIAMLWFREVSLDVSKQVLEKLNNYHVRELVDNGITIEYAALKNTKDYLSEMINQSDRLMQRNSIREMIVIMIALFVMFRIYNLIHKRQREIEVEKIKAEESNRAKSTFLSNMSHDIRTPLNAIIGYTEIAKKVGNIPEKELEYLDKIEASGHHLLALINDVLDMSRIESGKMELDIQCADLTEVIRNVYDLFDTMMNLKDIKYTVNVDEVIDKYVMCDANRINRVLINLVSNAHKFTASGGSIDVKLKQTDRNNGIASYEISVKDTGVGMSKEFAAKVFEAFEREDTASEVQGTGLGMAITKSIIDLMGGLITVNSEKGVGTEFVINVDLEIADDKAIKNQQIDVQSGDIDFAGMRALLVEDQSINREIATMILNQYGFVLEYAENGKEAVEKVVLSGTGHFGVIFMDIQMPVMNGYDAARAIRSLSNKELASIPIIAMTANAFSVDVKEAIEAGMDGHIAKPIEVDKLLKTLNEVLGNKEA